MLKPSGSLPIAVTCAPSCSNAHGAGPRTRRSRSRRRCAAPKGRSRSGRRCARGSCPSRRRRGRRAAARAWRVEQRLDLLLRRVDELLTVAVEELDAVVLGRVVRRGDDDAEVEREQRDGGRRQHAGEHGVPARLHDAARERFLERLTRRARVPPEKDALVGVRPQRRRARAFEEPRDEVAETPRTRPPCRAARRAPRSRTRRRRRDATPSVPKQRASRRRAHVTRDGEARFRAGATARLGSMRAEPSAKSAAFSA